MLVALAKLSVRARRKHLAIQLLWATARLLVTRVSLIYQVDELFTFEFLVLLKEMKTRGEPEISSCCFCVWCKSRELEGRGSPRFPCNTQVLESFYSDLLRVRMTYLVESHLESCQTSAMELSYENNKRLWLLDDFRKKLHRRCLTGLRICLLLKVLSLWSRLRVYEICSCREVYSEVVKAQSNYKKPYLWWFRNLACGDSNGSNRFEIDRVGVLPGPFHGNEGREVVWFIVSETPLHDWTNDGFFDVILYRINSVGI